MRGEQGSKAQHGPARTTARPAPQHARWRLTLAGARLAGYLADNLSNFSSLKNSI
jgi:hypothetical protein